MKEKFFNEIEKVFKDNKISINENQKQNFFDYFIILVEWNKKFNLTAITKMEEVILKHFLDSAAGAKEIPFKAKVIDIGAGAGFPSLPLKILRPDLSVLLVDSINKKVFFLQETIKLLGLKNTSVIQSRVEELANNPNFREKYDVCVSRAVASLNTLCEYGLPFVKVDGKMMAYKSFNTYEEINSASNAIKILGGKLEEVKIIRIGDLKRKIINIKKIFKTPKKFPRTANKPRISPL